MKKNKEVEKMKAKNQTAIKAGTLIIGTMLISSVSAKTINNSANLMEKELDFGSIDVNVRLLYGPSSLPLIVPFSNVEISAINLKNHDYSYFDKTDKDGRCHLVSMKPDIYRISADMEGYVDISSGFDKEKVVNLRPNKCNKIEFTLTEIGSPWDISEKSCETTSNLPIYYFWFCTISGRYDEVSSNEFFEIILTSNENSLRITGFAVVWLGDKLINDFRSIKTDFVIIEDFRGFIRNGIVTGIGLKDIRVGIY